MKLIKPALFVIFILMSFSVYAASEVVFILPLPSGALSVDPNDKGKIESTASSYLDKICNIMKQETGLDMTCVIIPRPTDSMLTPENIQQYIDTIEDYDYSGLYISSNDYYRLLLSGYDRLRPAVAISFFKKDYDEVCLYFRKDTKAEEVEDLRGLSWAGSYFYMPTRYVLFKNGIDEKPADFFGSIKLEPDDSWSTMAPRLMDGEIDVFSGSIEEESVGRIRNNEYQSIQRKFCTPHRSTHIIAFNRRMPEDEMKVVRKVLLGAHKNPAFSQFHFIFAAIQGHFIPFKYDAFDYTRQYVDTTIERGWVEEQIDFMYPDRIKEVEESVEETEEETTE